MDWWTKHRTKVIKNCQCVLMYVYKHLFASLLQKCVNYASICNKKTCSWTFKCKHLCKSWWEIVLEVVLMLKLRVTSLKVNILVMCDLHMHKLTESAVVYFVKKNSEAIKGFCM